MMMFKLLCCWLGILALSANAQGVGKGSGKGIYESAEATNVESIVYYGQNSETVELNAQKKETRMVDEVIQDTCYRQVPYQDRECRPVTRTRQECHQVPGYEDCRMVPTQECRNETRYRQECRNEPGQRVCRPGPGREVCVDRRNGNRVCTTQPGPDICYDAPGRNVCRNVPYTDRVCQTVNRRQCNWIPSRQECRNVTYTENECRDVTRYRDEAYSCPRTVQVPREIVVHEYKGEVILTFDHEALLDNAIVKVSLSDEGEIMVNVTETMPSHYAGFSKVVRSARRSQGPQSTLVRQEVKIGFLDLQGAKQIVERGAGNIKASREKISFNLELPQSLPDALWEYTNSQGKTAKDLTYIKLTVSKKNQGRKDIVLERTFHSSELYFQSLKGDFFNITIELLSRGIDLRANRNDIFEVKIENQLKLESAGLLIKGEARKETLI